LGSDLGTARKFRIFSISVKSSAKFLLLSKQDKGCLPDRRPAKAFAKFHFIRYNYSVDVGEQLSLTSFRSLISVGAIMPIKERERTLPKIVAGTTPLWEVSTANVKMARENLRGKNISPLTIFHRLRNAGAGFCSAIWVAFLRGDSREINDLIIRLLALAFPTIERKMVDIVLPKHTVSISADKKEAMEAYINDSFEKIERDYSMKDKLSSIIDRALHVDQLSDNDFDKISSANPHIQDLCRTDVIINIGSTVIRSKEYNASEDLNAFARNILRAITNAISHEYPNDPEKQAKALALLTHKYMGQAAAIACIRNAPTVEHDGIALSVASASQEGTYSQEINLSAERIDVRTIVRGEGRVFVADGDNGTTRPLSVVGPGLTGGDAANVFYDMSCSASIGSDERLGQFEVTNVSGEVTFNPVQHTGFFINEG
jgi:hypothetical protein